MRAFKYESTLEEGNLALALAPALTPSGVVKEPIFFRGVAKIKGGKPHLALESADRSPLSISLLIIAISMMAQGGDAVYYGADLLRQQIKVGAIHARVVRHAKQVLLQNPVVSPAKLVRELEKDIKLLPTLWPMLTESIKFASEQVKAGNKPPVWLNRILDVALQYGAYLLIATKEGYLFEEDANWRGLKEIAGLKSKSVVVGKALKLMEMLEL